MGKRRQPRIVVVGAGFGGLWAVRTLAFEPVEVLLVDRRNHHTFFPLLYQVAAAEIEPEAIAFPIRGLLRRFPNVGFEMAEVQGIDLTARRLETDGPPIDYDFLILAPGSLAHTFGVPGVAEHAFFLKDLDQAVAAQPHPVGFRAGGPGAGSAPPAASADLRDRGRRPHRRGVRGSPR